MGLFSKKPSSKALLEEALCDYKNENYTSSYEKICKAAELGDGRAYFCKALLIYNDNVAPDSEPDVDTLLSLTKKAVDLGYSLAYGFYAYVLHTCGRINELCDFCKAKSKVKDGVYLSFKASYFFGLYTDEENADASTTLATIKEAIASLRALDNDIKGKKSSEALEYALYNPYNKFKLNYTYSHAHFTLMTILYCQNDWSTRREFMAAFEEATKYMPIAEEKYRIARLYLKAIFDNYLGMKDFSEANRAMRIFNDCYNELDDDDRESSTDDYSEMYALYDEFYSSEGEALKNRDITYSDGYADKNDISIKNIASAIASGAASWANSSSGASSTVYTIGGVEYTRGEMGYLYDSQGFKSGYRVDDYSRLYNESDTELGYFNTNGNFISN